MSKLKEPLVSIIAICHQHAPFLIESLNSFRNQSYGNIELIIINNVKDRCEEIILNWIGTNSFVNKPIFIQNDSIKTVTQNCNLGLNICNGKYFQAISCDDIMLFSKIEMQVEEFERLDESYACVFGGINKINEKGEVLKDYLTRTSREMFIDRVNIDLATEFDSKKIVTYGAIPHAATFLFKTEIVNKLGQYEEQYFWEDYQMMLKLVYNNYKIIYLDKVLNHCRVLMDSLSRSKPTKENQYNVDWMYIDLHTRHSSIFESDYRIRNRFTRRFDSLLQYDKKEFLQYSIKFIRSQKFPSNIISFFNIYAIYPIASAFKLKIKVLLFQDKVYRWFTKSNTNRYKSPKQIN